jgi:hypothetical protein
MVKPRLCKGTKVGLYKGERFIEEAIYIGSEKHMIEGEGQWVKMFQLKNGTRVKETSFTWKVLK